MRPLTRAEVRAIDERAIREYGLPGIVLMENAGRGAAAILHHLAGGPRRVVVACGGGNNGGDGFVIARHLEALGHDVRLLLAVDPDRFRGDAGLNHEIASRAGIPMVALGGASAAEWEQALVGAEWIVDALLGTGSEGPPRGPIATAIGAIVATRAAGGAAGVLAVDLPSGLDCDTGVPPGDCVRSDATATFVARKAGFDAPGAAAFTGQVHVVGIGVPRRLLRELAGARPGEGGVAERA